MSKHTILALATALPLAATELPPMVDSGPVYYDDIIYQDAAPAPQAPAYTSPTYYGTPQLQPAAGHANRGEIILNAYSTNYQVRGMGVTNGLSRYGYSSLYGSYTLPNRNLFRRGIHQRISGLWGAVWGADEELGDNPQLHGSYAIGKELLPNLTLEAGYTLRKGGLEGYMARSTGCAHRITQDLHVSLRFNDHQRGPFGYILWGYGFQGLTGWYGDAELGYRFTDVLSRGNFGADLELSAGVAPSFGYWAAAAEGIDAYRLRAALRPFSHSGTFGREGRFQVTPWVQCSWTGHNSSKIHRALHSGPIDHFQFNFGLDVGYQF